MAHQKPTKEQLEADIKKAQEEIDALDKPEKIDPPIKENENPEEGSDDEENEEAPAKDGDDADGEEGKGSADEDEEDSSEENDDEDPGKGKSKKESASLDDKDKKEVDWKKAYAESTSEALLIRSKERKLGEAYDRAEALPEPTEEELAKEFPDWENLSEFEKKLAKKTLHNDRRFAVIEGVRQEFKDVEAHSKKVEEFVDDPKTLIKYSALEGKTEEFKVFAAKPSRQGADFADLVNAFLYKKSQERIKHKGKMFEDGDGGSKEKRIQKGNKLTLEQAAVLRKTNYKEYLKQVRADNIEDDTV